MHPRCCVRLPIASRLATPSRCGIAGAAKTAVIAGWRGVASLCAIKTERSSTGTRFPIDIDDQMHAEEALRRSERQLQQMIDAVPVRIWSATPDGRADLLQQAIPGPFPRRHPELRRARRAAHRDVAAGARFIPKTLPRCSVRCGTVSTPAAPPRCGFAGARRTAPIAGRSAGWSLGAIRTELSQSGTAFLSISTMRCARRRRCGSGSGSSRCSSTWFRAYIWRLTPDGEPTFFSKRLFDFFGLDDVSGFGQAGHEPAGGQHRGPRPSR